MKIGVVGAGITGLSAAWLIGSGEGGARHNVTLFEAEGRLGGHSNTVDVDAPEGTIPIDTGFIVYNPPAYPNLVALFARLDVETAQSNMSFSVSLGRGSYEYSGTGFNGYFGQRRNLASPRHWRMAAEIFRFHREAASLAQQSTIRGSAGPALGDFLRKNGYNRAFIDHHILPMAAAIWSAPAETMLEYPAGSFARFFANHQLLQASGHPVWRTVAGGSGAYVARLRRRSGAVVRAGEPVVHIKPSAQSVEVVTSSGSVELFDRVAICCHADTALGLLDQPTADERRVLASFRYSRNTAVLHTDRGLMPRRRRIWSSWNNVSSDPGAPVIVTYWMNSLQPLATKTDYFVTLNPEGMPAPGSEIARFNYEHPIFDRAAIEAQSAIWGIQGNRNVWFAGAHLGSGFHEDGLQAGLAVAEDMTSDAGPVVRPWTVPDANGRLLLPPGFATRQRQAVVAEAV